MLPEHADRRKTAGTQPTGAKDQAVVEIGPDGVLFRSAFVRRHGFRAGRGERDVDFARVHQADDLLEAFCDIRVGDFRNIEIFSGKLRLAKALDFRVFGKTNEVLVRVDNHVRGWFNPFYSRLAILEKLRDGVNRTSRRATPRERRSRLRGAPLSTYGRNFR